MNERRCCEPTYEGLKVSSTKLIKINSISCEPTYEGLKVPLASDVTTKLAPLRAYL